ncbi:Metal-dependent hydrolase [Arabidopsis thaliana x Arabidopsis arenosa]|uniref:Metal-dependent hydrolase n=1 Tax=Arabidopsis thaliana x Arabidopsis arenosa TaxID=1240361 RepID=A0A8T2AQ38_9BRAS|nr:Metal-dependent hydrolase [Arabidopsis thaliana x Arabidopsis arenosa]
MKLFDAHCHLQDKRVIDKASQLISAALAVGVTNFAVNGTSEKDWDLVKEMGETYPSVVPCFGLHPWFIADRSPHWFKTLKKFFETTPTAAVGEIGLDKGPLAGGIDYSDQLVVFRPQLELAKELNKPVAVHCIDAFDDLLEIMRSVGPFPAGVILHSFNGSAEVVPKLAELGAYFSFSGWFTYIDEKIAKKTLKSIPSDRFLLETDSPDGLPKSDESSSDPKPTLNEPANILAVLDYVANLSNMKKEELAELSYVNSVRLFSYPGSKLLTYQ